MDQIKGMEGEGGWVAQRPQTGPEITRLPRRRLANRREVWPIHFSVLDRPEREQSRQPKRSGRHATRGRLTRVTWTRAGQVRACLGQGAQDGGAWGREYVYT